MNKRIFWIAYNSCLELIKDRVVAGFMIVGMIFIMSGHILAELSVVERQKIILDVGLGTIFLIGVFITLFAGTNLIDREIRERTVFCSLSKPISRFAWIFGKTAGLLFVQLCCVFGLIIFLYFFTWFETRVWVNSLFLAGLFLFLLLAVVAGYTILFSNFTSQFNALFYGLLVVIIGHSVDDLRVYWGSKSGAAVIVTKILYYVLPDLKSFSPYPVVTGQVLLTPQILYLVLYAFSYVVVTLSLSVLILERREFE